MLLNKILLGFMLAAPIGPVSIEMIKRGLRKGFLSSFIVRVGGSIGNSLCLIAAYFGANLLLNTDTHKGICSLVGALVLLYLGFKALKKKSPDSFQSLHTDSKTEDYTLLSGLATGFVLSIANPMGIVFWFALSAVPVDLSGETGVWLGLAQNFAIILGVLIWGVILSGFLELGQRFVSPKWMKGITQVAGGMLVYFGLKYAYNGLVFLKLLA